jgi:N-acyl-D-amino-acid deacylase
MPADIVIRGGTAFDGSGVAGRSADVAIADGVIREIAPNLRGDVELDASGCAVTPGFIDIHTHYDAQVFWDPALRPSSYHGVTTVVAGNCGFAIAPTRPEHRDVIVHTLENVEDMDPATLVAGIAWDFETFPEYLDSVRRRGTALNFTAYVGHSPLRLYVMGDAAYERAATADEIERMGVLVREGIAAGAAGFSTSFSYAHRGVDGKPVPSRFAEADEVEALFLAAGEAGKGVVLITPGAQCTYADVYEWQPRVGRPFTYPMFASPGGKHLEPLALHEQGLARGAEVWPQVTPRPLTMQFTMADPYSLNTGKVFGELLQGDRDGRIAAYRDAAWRERAAADLEQSPMKPRWETFEVSE